MKNNTAVVALLALIIGFGGGYLIQSDEGQEMGEHRMADGHMMNDGVMDMDSAMSGMTMSLEGKTGDALDKAFLDGMIVHHQGAVTMAQALLAGTKRPELIKLGNDIITAQTGEIKMMQDWRTQWFAK